MTFASFFEPFTCQGININIVNWVIIWESLLSYHLSYTLFLLQSADCPYNYYGMSTADHPQSYPVFVHELGHSFAGLADEYFNSEVAYNDFYNLTVEPWEPNITTLVNFDVKWKNILPAGTLVPTPPDKINEDKIGVFEGGGYVTKGVFRPMINCRMRSNGAVFCPVCQRAINLMIDVSIDQ